MQEEVFHKAKTRKILLSCLILALIGYGLFLRVYGLGEQSLWIDEGYTINASQAILERGIPLLDSGKVYRGGLLTTYFTAGAMRALPFDPFSPWSARLPSAFFGILTVIAASYLAHALFRNYFITLGTLGIVTFSYWEIAWSRQARGYAALSFFTLLSLIFVWRFFKRREKSALILSFLAGLGAIYSQHLGALVFPASFAAFCIAMFAQSNILSTVRKRTLTLIFCGVCLAAFAFFIIATRFTRLAPLGFEPEYLGFLFKNIGVFTIGSIIAALLTLFDAKRFTSVYMLFAASALPILIVTLYSPVIQFRYLFPFFPLLIILTTYTVWRVTEITFRLLSKHSNILHLPAVRHGNVRMSYLAAGTIMIVLALPSLSFMPRTHYALEFGSPQPDFKTVLSIIKNDRDIGCPNRNDNGGDIRCPMIIISPYAHLHQIYLGEKGYWLPMSLSGKQNEIEKNKIETDAGVIDSYVGAPVVRDLDHLQELLDTQSGFLIIDDMARRRLKSEVALIESNPRVRITFKSKGDNLGSIWLYRFGN